jgi:hypothetical protein
MLSSAAASIAILTSSGEKCLAFKRSGTTPRTNAGSMQTQTVKQVGLMQ